MERLEGFRGQRRNANRHTRRGKAAVRQSMEEVGYVAPMTCAADGEVIDGSARLEMAGLVFGGEVLVVEHDGTRPVVMRRVDVGSVASPKARAIALAANRAAELGLDWDPAVLLEDLEAGVDLTDLWSPEELAALEPVELRDVGTAVPPRMSWVLIGVPTVRFGEIAALVESVAAVPGVVVETTANDGPQDR